VADTALQSSREAEFTALSRARGLRPVGPSHVDATLRRLAAFFAQAALREQIARRPGILQHTDPRARLLAVLVFLVSVSLARSLPSLGVHALLPVLALGLSRIRLREFLGAGFGLAAAFAVLIAAPATLNLFVSGTLVIPLVTLERGWQFGPLEIPQVIGATREGLLSAATFLSRVLASAAAVLWVTLCTAWMDLLRALRAVGVPALVVQVVGMTVRYLFALQRMIEEAYLGKRSRAICRAPMGHERAWVASRVGHTWEKSLGLMTEVHEAMTARGFTGEIRSSGGARFGWREWGLLIATLVACGAAHVH
jgi:energy-coupling factor transporter transmembrane protein EcfT